MNTREAVNAETIMRSSGRALVDIPSRIVTRASRPKLVRFTYCNWRGDVHEYVVKPESIELGPYDGGGYHSNDREGEPSDQHWVFHGEVVTRDGDTRPDMGTRRRTFLLGSIDRLEIMENGR